MLHTDEHPDGAVLHTTIARRTYSINEVAEQLGVSRDTVVRLVKGGHLTYVQMPGKGVRVKRLIERTELLRFIAANRVEATR